MWFENVDSKNVLQETRRQIHKNMDLSTFEMLHIYPDERAEGYKKFFYCLRTSLVLTSTFSD